MATLFPRYMDKEEIKHNIQASKMLWVATILYILQLMFPIASFTDIDGTAYIYAVNIFSNDAMAYYIISTILVGYAAKLAGEGKSVKIYAWSSLLPMSLILYVIFDFIDDRNSILGDDFVGLGSGVYIGMLGMIVAIVGGALSKKIPTSEEDTQE